MKNIFNFISANLKKVNKTSIKKNFILALSVFFLITLISINARNAEKNQAPEMFDYNQS